MRSGRLQAIALLGVLCLNGAVAIVLIVPPASQYELSIYRAYPGYFWALVVGALFAGVVVIVGSARRRQGRSWILGLAIAFVTNVLLLLMPAIRGYQMYGRSDALSHIGFVRDILSTGSVAGNLYPPSHLLILTLADATGSNPMVIAMFVPVVFSVIYFGGMFYLLVYLFDMRQKVLYGLPFVALPVLRSAHLGIRPFDWSIMLIPIVLYMFVKFQQNPLPAGKLVFVVGLVALLLYHPLTALYMIVIFSIYPLRQYLPQIDDSHSISTVVFSISAAVFIAWYSNFPGVIFRFIRIYQTLSGRTEGDPPLGAYTETAQEVSLPLLDVLRVLTFKYGLELLLFGLGFASIPLMLWLVLQDDLSLSSNRLMMIGMFVTFSLGGLAFLVTDLIVPPERLFQVAKIAAVVLAGELVSLSIARLGAIQDSDRIRSALVAGFLAVTLVLVVLSTFSLYPSPLESEKNHQVTQMEMEGSKWLTERSGEVNQVSAFGIRYYRYHDALYGASTEQPVVRSVLPAHFNYTVHDDLGQSYENDTYLMITRFGRIVYPEGFPNYPENWAFTPSDFDRLERDETTARIYDNGDHTQYLIEGTRTRSSVERVDDCRPGIQYRLGSLNDSDASCTSQPRT